MGGKQKVQVAKRLTKVVHPNSRKALEIAAKEHHKNKTNRVATHLKQRHNVLIKKLLWFQNEIKDEVDESECVDMEAANKQQQLHYTVENLHGLVAKYFERFDDEINQINLKNSIGKRKGDQHFSRMKAIEITLEQEKNEYATAGIVVPDLTLLDNVVNFKKWNGDSNALPSLKLKTLKKIKN